MEVIHSFFIHPILLSGFFSWFIAQFLKSIILFFRRYPKISRREWVLTLVWSTGGMPSSHSAVVSAVTIAVGCQEGFNSTFFLMSFFFSALVIRDALGIRQATGNQAQVINLLIKDLNARTGGTHKPVKAVLGHKVHEVVVGIFLGGFLAIAFYNL